MLLEELSQGAGYTQLLKATIALSQTFFITLGAL